jgi:tetratricopeptide (TPR) repeat protein
LTAFLGREPFTFEERVAITALLVAYFVHNIFVFDNLVSYIFFFTFLGFVHTHYAEEPYAAMNEGIKKNREALETVAVPAIVVVAIIGVFYLNYTPLMNSLKLSASLSPRPQEEGGIQKNIQMFNELASDSFFGRYEAREQIVLLASRLAPIGPDRFDPAIKDQIYSLAYTEMKKQLEETPRDARYYYFMTGLLSAYGRFAEALPVIEKGVTLSPNKQLLISNYGTVLFRLGQKEKALEQFKKAFELDTRYTSAGIQYFAAKEDYPKLIEQIEKYVSEVPGDTQMIVNWAFYTAKNGDKVKAKALFDRAAAQDPNLIPQIEQAMKDLRIK